MDTNLTADVTPTFSARSTAPQHAVFFTAIALLPISFVAVEQLLGYVADHTTADPRLHGSTPLFPLAFSQMPVGAFAAFVVLAFAQSAALAIIWRRFSSTPPSILDRTVVMSAAVVMGVVAFTANVTTSADLYAYIAYGILHNPYQPTPFPAGSPFAAAEVMWGRPVVVCVYGPLWVDLNHVLLSHVASISEAVPRLRLLSLAAFVALAAALRLSGARFGTIALLILNPGFWRLWIADAHMDLPALVVIVAAGALAARGRLAAAVPLIIVAGLYKITLGAIGLVAIVHERAVARIGAAASIVIGISLFSLLLGGRPYLEALRGVGTANTSFGAVGIVHIIVVACAALTIAAAVVSDKVWKAATWTLPTIGANLLPWYVGWSLPYAIRVDYAPTFFIAFPILAATVGTRSAGLGYAVLAILALAAIMRHSLLDPGLRRAAPGKT